MSARAGALRALGRLGSLLGSAATRSAGGGSAPALAALLLPAGGARRAAASAAAPPGAALRPVSDKEAATLARVRNIGISAHIDSGKTTTTERILFYTGRIKDIHEVRGRDGVGAKMDSMELEREKGITIQSAATYCSWGDTRINIIDTPGHVDFTIEVERALRVLDGAVLLLCGVGGVQSQSITVDRQMRRYGVPRLVFVNKLDRVGAAPWRVIAQARDKLRLNAAAVQVPIGLEEFHEGVVDLVRRRALTFGGAKGLEVIDGPVPAELADEVEARRAELIERVSEVDDGLAELFLAEEPISAEALAAAIRRATLANRFAPVFMGSAYKNKGVQPLLDGVADYLPCPTDVPNTALDIDAGEAPVTLPCSPSGPFVGLAFKLEEGKYGQLTYMRVYSGTVAKGDFIVNSTSRKRTRVPRLVRIHSDELEDIPSAARCASLPRRGRWRRRRAAHDARPHARGPPVTPAVPLRRAAAQSAGDIVALFGIECASGDTFTDGSVNYAMTSIKVPEPVMSVSLTPKSTEQLANFQRALARFQREDPTFTVSNNAETGETIISGMGELHLDIYVERMRREYKVDCEVGRPKVNYREAIQARAEFNYLHKKQSGGSGQYGKVGGYIEPLPEDEGTGGGGGGGPRFEYSNEIVGNVIPPEFYPAIEKGFREAANAGSLIGAPVEGIRVVLNDGGAHAVDSNEMAFRLAAIGGFRQAYASARPTILEPVMKVEVTVPVEFQGGVMGDLNRRKGMILDSRQEAEDAVIEALVPLNAMFGYSTVLRSNTQGKGEFTMEYASHQPVTKEQQEELANSSAAARAAAKGLVKDVVSGDTVVLVGASAGPAVPAEKRLTLSSLVAPRLGKRDGTTRDEPFAWESREFLRKKLIGQACVFKVDYTVEVAGNKEFGSIILQNGSAQENVAVSIVQNGWAKVRESGGGAAQKQSPYYDDLVKAQEAAQAGGKGLWNKDPGAIAASLAPAPADFNAMSFFQSVGKGKPVAGVVEAVLNGSTLRLTLLPERTPVTVAVAGVQCPNMGKRPPPAAAPAPAAANGDAAPAANGDAAPAAAPAPPPAAGGAVTAASIAAAGVAPGGAGGAGAPGGPEPLAREAKWFTERRALGREVRVVLEGVDKYGNLFGSVFYPEAEKPANLAEALMSAGLARAVEWGLAMMTNGAMRLREMERASKAAKRGIWANYVPANTGQTKLSDSFLGRVVEVVSGDTMVIKDVNAGVERRVSLSSIRAPRAGGRDRAPEPHGLDAREFLRKRFIGKEVTVKMEYTRRIGPAPPQPTDGAAPAADDRGTMSFGGVELNHGREGEDRNAAEMVVARGFASVIRHRSDEERSSVYEALVDLEEKAKQAKRGIHSSKEVAVPRVNDVSTPGNGARAKQYLPFLQRAGKVAGVVEMVSSGHRLKIHIPKEGVTIAMAPSGVRAPQRPMPAMGGRPAAPGEPHGDEAYAWTREHFNQREVEIEVETADKGGTFLGTITLPGPKPVSLGHALARMGLAKTQPFFAAERVKGGAELMAAIQAAKEARLKVTARRAAARGGCAEGAARGRASPSRAARACARPQIWSNWTPEDDAVATGGDDDAAPGSSAPGGGETLAVTVTEVVDGGEFFVQSATEPRVAWLEEQLRTLGLEDAPPGTGLVQGAQCVGQFSLDNNWYRGYVERVSPTEPKYEVFFVDFGNREALPSDRVRPIDAALAAVPPQARPAALAYLRVPGLDEEFGADAAATLAALVGGGRRFTATVVRRERGGGAREKHPRKAADKLFVSLVSEDGEVDVAKEMLLAGMARLPKLHKVRDPVAKAAISALMDQQDEARKGHTGMWEYGDPGDSDDEEPAPRPAWGKPKK
ncbi:elongation factor G [Scenedesmus sp. PABB004]|nr:elongation factor G [Scenedesmus sp. PABB004]